MSEGVKLMEKAAPNLYKLINEFPTLAKSLVKGDMKSFKSFFRTGDANYLKAFDTKANNIILNSGKRPMDGISVSKGFVKGNEVPRVGVEPISETGLNIRRVKPVTLTNPVNNPAEQWAARDFNKIAKPSEKVNTQMSTGRPTKKVMEEISYPKVKTS